MFAFRESGAMVQRGEIQCAESEFALQSGRHTKPEKFHCRRHLAEITRNRVYLSLCFCKGFSGPRVRHKREVFLLFVSVRQAANTEHGEGNMKTGRIDGMRDLGALVAFAFALFCGGTTVAMPSQAELSEAQPLVNELMSPLVKDYKAKKKTAAEVGDRAMAFVDEANTQAAKFVLLKGAVHYYALAKEYDKTADAIESIMKLVPDLPPKTLYEITSKAASSTTAKTAPRLFDLNKSAKDRMTVATRLKAIEKDLRSTPADLKLVRMHAELTAAAGSWDEALVEFAKLGGAIGQMAKAESEATGKSAELADFWWNYKPTAAEAKDAIRAHAVSLYRSAIDNGELDGLKKSVAEKRIAEAESTTTNDSEADRGNSGYGKFYKAEAPVSQINKAPIRKDGLLHRWSFNRNLKDSVGNSDGKAVDGAVNFERGQVRIRPGGGFVDLGANVLPKGGNADYTIEIWATKHSIQNWARVFDIQDCWGDDDYFWAWNFGKEPQRWQWKVSGLPKRDVSLGADGTGIGVENHFVVVYGHDEKPYIQVYILRGENVYWSARERLMGGMCIQHSAFWLGHSAYRFIEDKIADASYNEVRIWDRALTRDEVLLSAKLGPDKLP